MLYVSLCYLLPTTATQVQPQQPANKCVRHKTFHQRVQLQTAATATATATTTTTKTTARKVMAKHLEIKQSQCVFKSPPPPPLLAQLRRQIEKERSPNFIMSSGIKQGAWGEWRTVGQKLKLKLSFPSNCLPIGFAFDFDFHFDFDFDSDLACIQADS